MHQHLSSHTIQTLMDERDIAQLTYPGMVELFSRESAIRENAPKQTLAHDPRSDEPVVYNTARRRRPFELKHRSPSEEDQIPKTGRSCVICSGKTTRIVDLAPLSEGFTFINKNLFPAVWPASEIEPSVEISGSAQTGRLKAFGLHFLQWTSSYHNRDWHNMPHADCVIALSRLARLEEQLLTTSSAYMPPTTEFGDPRGYAGFVSIIKNGGAEVGGSIAHPHQQIIFSNIMPRRVHENWHFQLKRGISFAEHLLRTTPPELLVREYESAVLLTPSFMRRPGDMFLIVKDTRKRYLHQLNPQELKDVSRGWQDAIASIHGFMPSLGRPTAYNVITLNGPGAGLHFAFLPYTQETGGFEQLGLSVCQAEPHEMAEMIRSVIPEQSA